MSNMPDSGRAAALILLICLSFLPRDAVAQQLGEGSKDTLVLSTAMCDGDAITMAKCLDRQNGKADRWLDAIVASSSRQAAEAMADLAHGGNAFDQVAQLRKSQAAFEQYRAETSDLVRNYGLVGSINKLDALRTYY